MDEMDEVFETVARYFSILAEPARLRILHSISSIRPLRIG